jgi:hypothetical protein
MNLMSTPARLIAAFVLFGVLMLLGLTWWFVWLQNGKAQPRAGSGNAATKASILDGTSNFSCADKPTILLRSEWKAKAPVGEMKRHTPGRLTIHHTASRQMKNVPIEEKMRSLQSFSQRSGRLANGRMKPTWPDVPYHFYIAADGLIAEGREIQFVGDTNTDYDPTGHLLIVLEGNFEEEEPTSPQLASLCSLLSMLSEKWHIQASEIKGHKDYAATACPGTNLEKQLPQLQRSVAQATRFAK